MANIRIDDSHYDKLVALQTAYKEKYGKFISLGNLINLIISLPNFVRDLEISKH